MDKKQLKGLWRSHNMPLYFYNDDVVITIHVTDRITVWMMNNKDNVTFASGEYEIERGEHDIFYICVRGEDTVLSEEYRKFECRMHLPQKPASFLITIPSFGVRYMQQVNEG